MKHLLNVFVIIFVFAMSCGFAFGQGCSDAGVCSIDFSDTNSDEAKSVLSVKQSYGLHDKTSIYQTSLAGKISFYGMFAYAEIPYVVSNGSLGSLNSLGDATLVLGLPYEDFIFNLGFKLATNDANLLYEEESLPMEYQSSQGTNDLLFSVNYNYASYLFAVGYQHVLNYNNKNNYFIRDSMGIISSINLERGNDIFASVKREFKVSDFKYTIGLNAIYRLQESRVSPYDDPNIRYITAPTVAKPYYIENSDGLTLNITGATTYKINDDYNLGLNLGFPVINRKDIRDGLKRNFQINLGLNYIF